MNAEKQLSFLQDENNTTRQRYAITLYSDTLILSAIIIVLIMALLFSLGVERGRHIALLQQTTQQRAQTDKVLRVSESASSNNPVQPLNAPASSETQEGNIEALLAEANTQQHLTVLTASQKAENQFNAQETCAIQLASFMQEPIAQKEAKRLEEKGYRVSVLKKGKYIVVFVNFKDTNEAQKNIATLKKKYKDCFIRRL